MEFDLPPSERSESCLCFSMGPDRRRGDVLVGRSRQEAVRKEGGTEVGDIAGQPPWEGAVAARVIEGVRTIFWLPEQPHPRLKLDVIMQGGTIVGTFVGLGREDIPVS